MRPQNLLQFALSQAPKKVVGTLGAAVDFAVIGVVNTFSFMVDKTANLIAWAADDKREESWAPVLIAMLIVIWLTYLLIKKSSQETIAQNNSAANAQALPPTFTPQHMQAMIQAFSKMQSAQPSTTSSTFSPETKNMFRGMFNKNERSPKLEAPQSAEDAMLDEAFATVASMRNLSENASPPSAKTPTRPSSPEADPRKALEEYDAIANSGFSADLSKK